MVRENAPCLPTPRPVHDYLPVPRDRPLGPAIASAARDSVRSAVRRLAAKDRQFLLMYYTDGLTLREIGCVLSISESAAGLRYGALIAKLRQTARRGPTTQEGGPSW